MDDTKQHPLQKIAAHIRSELPYIDPEEAARFLIENPLYGYNTFGGFNTIKPLDVRACEAHKARIQGPAYKPTGDYEKALDPNSPGNYAKIRPGYTQAPPPPPQKKSIHHDPLPDPDDEVDLDPEDPFMDDFEEDPGPPASSRRELSKLPRLTTGRYVTFPLEVLYDPDVKMADMCIYACIATWTSGGKPVTLATSRLSQLAGCSMQYVRDAVTRLTNAGHLDVRTVPYGDPASRRRITQYTLTSPVFALRAHKKGN